MTTMTTANPTTTPMMMIEARRLLRDTTELEGSLLATQPVVVGPHNIEGLPVAETVSTASETETPFYQQSHDEPTILLPTIPCGDASTNHNPQRDRQVLAYAERRGKQEAEAEKALIRREKTNVFARNYHETAQVKRANEFAAQMNRLEKNGIYNNPEHPKSASPFRRQKKQQLAPAVDSTFGKGYQVSEYQVGSYDTSDYQISEYKSIYDD